MSETIDARKLTAPEFDAAFRKLLAAARNQETTVGCVGCERCSQIAECTFCADSTNLLRCNYCAHCDECTECSHCRGCRSCIGCQHCIDSERCTASAYLVRCVGCSGSAYDFGCVGLTRRDFHILNQPYDRATYFAIATRLARDLGVRMP
jgi:hypothetical protein